MIESDGKVSGGHRKKLAAIWPDTAGGVSLRAVCDAPSLPFLGEERLKLTKIDKVTASRIVPVEQDVIA